MSAVLAVLRGMRPLLPYRWRVPLAFDPAQYLAANPDVGAGVATVGAGGATVRTGGATVRMGVGGAQAWAALRHFLRHGRAEGRLPCTLRAAALEAALWAGQDSARAALEALAHSASGSGPAHSACGSRPAHSARDPEALWAAVALARRAAMAGDWAAAADLLPPPALLLAGLGLPGPLLLCAEMALRRGRPAQARAVLGLVRAGFGPLAELHLMQAALARAEGRPQAARAALARIYAPQGLACPDPVAQEGRPVPPPGLAAFDRLTTGDGRREKAVLGKAVRGNGTVRAAIPAPGPDGPLISVVMPARNAGATIGTALAGLMAQSWHRLEVLVVENGSSDDTRARVADWARRDPRIRLLEPGAQEGGGAAAAAGAAGAYGARNLGALAAAGDILALHDADDWSHPDRLALQMRLLQGAPQAVGCLSHWLRVTPDLCPALWRPDVGGVHPNLSSLMLRRAVTARVGLWDARARAGADTEFVARLRHVCGAESVPVLLPGVPLAFGRVGAGALTQGAQTGLLGPGAGARSAYLAAARHWHRRRWPQPILPQPSLPQENGRDPAPPRPGTLDTGLWDFPGGTPDFAHPFAVPMELRVELRGGLPGPAPAAPVADPASPAAEAG